MFHSARLKLTAWYLFIIMFVSISFSMVIYRMVSVEVERFARVQRFRIERRFIGGDQVLPLPPVPDPELVAEIDQRVILMLLIVNTGILVAAGILGYWLAGRTLSPIQQMIDEQNRFISDASHELRTPLTALKSSLEVNLRDSRLTLKNARQVMTESVGEVNKLQSLSDGLLELAQFQKPSQQIAPQMMDIPEVIQAAIGHVESLAEAKKIRIVSTPGKFKIKGHPASIEELLIILLENAVKYSPNGKHIWITAKKTDGHLNITVRDEGVGVSETDLPHIFDRFYRADNTRSKAAAAGYGLGLSIAKEIVKVHNGTIAVTSEVNTGTTFTVSLPFS
jgi:signal transduction histidine kinase